MLKRFTQFRVAFLNLFEQTDVLDRNDRLGRKRFQQRHLLVRKWLDLRAADANQPNGRPLPHKRRHKKCSNTAPHVRAVRVFLCLRLKVRNVNCPALEQSLIADRAPFQASPCRHRGRYRSEMCRQEILIAIEKTNRRVVGSAHPRSTLGDRVENGLGVSRRASDDTEDLACRSLLLQRLLEFVEQPNVLNGNHCLISEGFKQLDLRRGKGAHLEAACSKCSNKFSLQPKGRAQVGAPSVAQGGHIQRRNWRRVIFLRLYVGNVERTMLAHPAMPWVINADHDTANREGPKMSPRDHLFLFA